MHSKLEARDTSGFHAKAPFVCLKKLSYEGETALLLLLLLVGGWVGGWVVGGWLAGWLAGLLGLLGLDCFGLVWFGCLFVRLFVVEHVNMLEGWQKIYMAQCCTERRIIQGHSY